MITYQHLFGFVILNLIILIVLILIFKLSKKAERHRVFCYLYAGWFSPGIINFRFQIIFPPRFTAIISFLRCLLRSSMDLDAGYRL